MNVPPSGFSSGATVTLSVNSEESLREVQNRLERDLAIAASSTTISQDSREGLILKRLRLICCFLPPSWRPAFIQAAEEFERTIRSPVYLNSSPAGRAAIFAHLWVHLIQPAYQIVRRDEAIEQLDQMADLIHDEIRTLGFDPKIYFARYRRRLNLSKKSEEENDETALLVREAVHKRTQEVRRTIREDHSTLIQTARALQIEMLHLHEERGQQNHEVHEIIERLAERVDGLIALFNDLTSQTSEQEDLLSASEDEFRSIISNIIRISEGIK